LSWQVSALKRQPVRFEGYGPGGAAVLVECLTDNRNRTVADLRSAFARNGGNLGATGSVAYLFNEVGLMTYPPGADDGRLIQCALDAGAEDVVRHDDGSVEVLTDPEELDDVRSRLEASGFTPSGTDVTQRAAIPAPLRGEAAEAMVSLLGTLQNLEDVQNVYSNAQVPDEVLARV
jgi:YebC/PmpR family DNA-binding regulatory protein